MALLHALKDVRTIKTLLTRAGAEAVRSGDDLPGPEHLLLSALALPDGTAAAAFTHLGVDPGDFRTAVDRTHRDALDHLGLTVGDGLDDLPGADTPAGPYRMTASGQQAFQRAVTLSKETKPSLLRAAHIVIAVCEQGRGTVARALQTQGIDRIHLAAAAREALATP
ncbi:Clp protease N-terminal domain-containing protein [Couchioplanes caeruleus]|uniref:Clp R domain-containing protein n=2 Tax=Couchioplanes caeruleus TaxID=56438 RepID=A0A1K0FDG0_9ACTN|nr:Clp protease N-terminal domain-containing protein [Couchioplanes caeruleus]OJF10879.1 hypothetical protein BG844_29835 [Couchioplanes caeruleus subsp. caeruleus]ROP32781.1 ClpA/ClpB-like protein [Couchioplanes caeruleus]